jgi:hypothetical protein
VKARLKWGWIGALAVLAACAGIGTRAPEDAVHQRAQARWDALLNGDFHAAYEYLSPGSKSVQSEKGYIEELRKGFWKSAKVQKVQCRSNEACDAEVAVEYEYQGMRTRTPVRESWVREGSEWWYVKK